jgi:hypothetical protein
VFQLHPTRELQTMSLFLLFYLRILLYLIAEKASSAVKNRARYDTEEIQFLKGTAALIWITKAAVPLFFVNSLY